MKVHSPLTLSLLLALCFSALLPAFSAPKEDKDKAPVVPEMAATAIFPFQERGSGVKDYGMKISDIIFASLATNADILMVDRAEMQKMLDEAQMNISGMVSPSQATQVGQLIGAKIIVTGSVFLVDKSIYLTAKIIGTETSRVFGESVKGNVTDDLSTLTDQLAEKISARITTDTDKLVAKPPTVKDVIEDVNKALGTATRPTVVVTITERHVGQFTIDPAAETEMVAICKGTGFTVMESGTGIKGAYILIKGEGISEFATKIGNLVCVKARLEVKAINPVTNEVLAIDRQTVMVVDLTEQIAGKSALQQASALIAERLLPKLVKK
ncbi:MAG: CsgG/HfaB family protein [Armatimonadota bacterium]